MNAMALTITSRRQARACPLLGRSGHPRSMASTASVANDPMTQSGHRPGSNSAGTILSVEGTELPSATLRFRTIQVYPKDCRSLPGHS